MGELLKVYPDNAQKDPDKVLQCAVGDFSEVIVLGFNKDGHIEGRVSLELNEMDAYYLLQALAADILSNKFSWSD